MQRRVLSASAALAAAVAVAVAGGFYPSPAAATRTYCVGAEEARVHASGEDGGPPRFIAAFYRRLLVLEVSLDGADGSELPISIEEVCNVPKRLKRQAAQLAGGEGVALLVARTTVWHGDTQVTGDPLAGAIDGADTASLRVRLQQPSAWREDEDGNKVPTFRTGRVEITD
jgi:hypothetical protein